MPYSMLVSELSLKIDKYEQALDMADNQGRTFVRTPLVQALRLDTKEFDAQMKNLGKGLGVLSMKAEIQVGVIGQGIAEGQLKVLGESVKKVDATVRQFEDVLSTLDKKGYGAFASTLRAMGSTEKGAESMGRALETALKKLDEIGTIKPASANWNVSIGGAEKIKEAEAALKTLGDATKKTLSDTDKAARDAQKALDATFKEFIGGEKGAQYLDKIAYQLREDARFTQVFNTHLGEMQKLLEGVGNEGSKAGAQIQRGLEAADKTAKDLERNLESAGKAGGKAHNGAGWKEQIASVAMGIGVYNGFAQAVGFVVDGLKEGISYNARLQQVLQGFQTELGGSSAKAKQLYVDLENLNDKSSLREGDLFPAAQKLLAAKVPLDELKKSLQAIDDQTAALGGNGEKFQQISTAMGQIFLKPHLQLEEITRQLLEAGVPAFDLLAKAYHTNTKQIQEWISKGMIPGKEAFKALTNQMERNNFGAAERQSRTLAGAFSTLADRIERGLGLSLDSTTGLLTNLLNRLVYISGDKRFQEWVSRVGHAVAQGFAFVGTTVKDAVLFTLNWEKNLIDVSAQGIDLWVGAWREGAGSVWDVLKFTAHNMAWFADVSSQLTQRAFGGGGDFFQKSVDGLIGGIEGAAIKIPKVTDLINDFKTAFGEVYGPPKGLDMGKLWDQSGKYADGLLKMGGKPPAEYNPTLGAPKAENAAKEADKFAAAMEKQARATEDWAKRNLNALKTVSDSFHTLLGSMQTELAKRGLFSGTPLDGYIAKLQQLLNLGGRAEGVVAQALKVSGDYWDRAATARQQAQTVRDALNAVPGAGISGADVSSASPSQATRFLTTFKTREEMIWSDAFKSLAEHSGRVQNLVSLQFGGNWDKMFKVMGDTSEATRQRLMRLAAPVSSVSVERFVHPDQWSAQRFADLSNRFRSQAQAEIGPRTGVPRIDGRNPDFEADSGLDPAYYAQLIDKRARALADQYLRKIGELRTLTTTTTGYDTLDFGHIKRTQERFQKAITVATAPIGGAVDTTAPGEMPASTARAGAVSPVAVTTNVMDALARGISTPAGMASCGNFAGQLLDKLGVSLPKDAKGRISSTLNVAKNFGDFAAANGTPVDINSTQLGDVIIYHGQRYGKLKFPGGGYHVAVAEGGGKMWESSGDGPGNQHPSNIYDTRHATAYRLGGAASLRIPSFLNAMGVGDAATMQTGDNGVQAFKDNVQELLKGLRVEKFALPKEWGKPVRDAADNATVFQSQMLLANETFQTLLRAIYGPKFGAIVKTLREGSYAFDKFIKGKALADDLQAETEQGIRDKRARGHEDDPFYSTRTKYTVDGHTNGVSIFALATREQQISDDIEKKVQKSLEKLRATEAERFRVVGAGRPFIQGATVDLYKYARAIEVAQQKLEYARSKEMVDLFHDDKKKFNVKLADFVGFATQRYESQKGTERELGFATQTRDMDRRLAQLQAEQSLVGNVTLSESQLNIELDKQGYYFGQLYALRDAGHSDERSRQLATELTARNALNAAMERAIAAEKEWNKSLRDSAIGAALNGKLRDLYTTMRGDSPQLSRSIFEAQTRSELGARFNSGDFDVPINGITAALRTHRGIATAPDIRRDPLELEKRVQLALQNFDDKTATDRVGEASAKFAQLQTDLFSQRLTLMRGISDATRQQLTWDNLGIKPSQDELDLRTKILGVINQTSALKLDTWMKDQARQDDLASAFNPDKRADLQFRFDHPDWSAADIDAMLPVDRIERHAREGFARIQSLSDDFRSSWTKLWEDAATKGTFSFNTFFNSIISGLAKFGADAIANRTMGGLEGLLGKLTGVLGAPTAAAATYTPPFVAPGFAKGLDFVPYDNFAANLHHGEAVLTASQNRDWQMMQAARDLTMGAARESANSGGGDVYYVTNQITHTGNIVADSPTQYRARMDEEMQQQGSHPSRRSLGKHARVIAGLER